MKPEIEHFYYSCSACGNNFELSSDIDKHGKCTIITEENKQKIVLNCYYCGCRLRYVS